MAWEPLRLPRSHDSVCHPEPLPVVLALPSTSPTHATGAEPPALPRAASPVVKRGRRPLRGQRLFDTALLVSEAANRAAAWPYTPPELDPVEPPCPLSSSLGRPRSSLLLPPEAHVAKQSLQDLKIELLRATVRAFDETLCCSPTKEAEPAGASADASDALATEEAQREGASEEQVFAFEASVAEAAAQAEVASAAGVERELPSEVSTVLDDLDPAIVEAYHALPVRKKAAPPLPSVSPSRVESLRQALELDERFLGVHSPFLLPLLCGLGCALVKAGKAEEALVLGERATEILVRMGSEVDSSQFWQLRELAQLMETHGAYECACKLYRMRHVVAIECFSDSSLQRMAAAHDLAMILLHVYKIKRPRRDAAAARSLSLAAAKGRSSSSLNDSSSSEDGDEEIVDEEGSGEEDEALREARQGAALWMTDVNLSDAITPLHINFANVQEAYELLQECLVIEANHSRIGDDGTSKPRAFPDWLADFNPEEIDDTRWWWSIGDSTRLGLCEIRQLRGDWQGAMDDLYRMSCVQQKREGTDPEQKLMVFGRLADLARRYDSSLAVWPLEQTLDVLLTEFDAPDKLQEVKDELIELLCHLGRHAAVTRILNKCGDELQSTALDTSMRRMQIVYFNQQQAAMLLQRFARGMLARSRRSAEERAAVSAQDQHAIVLQAHMRRISAIRNVNAAREHRRRENAVKRIQRYMRHKIQRKRKALANAKDVIEETTDQHTADQRTLEKPKTDQRVNALNDGQTRIDRWKKLRYVVAFHRETLAYMLYQRPSVDRFVEVEDAQEYEADEEVKGSSRLPGTDVEVRSDDRGVPVLALDDEEEDDDDDDDDDDAEEDDEWTALKKGWRNRRPGLSVDPALLAGRNPSEES